MEGTGPVILDCDPGHDDALAILLAARHLEVVGITTVAGNQTLEKVTANALRVLEVGGLAAIPVHPGAAAPLAGEVVTAGDFHGESGLDGADLPDPTTSPRREHAVEFLARTVAARDGVTVIATGPLTNLALALDLHPGIADRIAELSLMGGSMTSGNVTPVAEFNVWADPEATRVVLRSGIPIRMVGLNLTHQAEADAGVVDRMRGLRSRVGRAAADLVEFLIGRDPGTPNAALLHDPCAVAWLIAPELITGHPLHVDVELAGALTRGMTVCDHRHLTGGPCADRPTQDAGAERGGPNAPNALVGLHLDREGFLDLLLGGLAGYG